MMNSYINPQCQYLVQAPLAVMVALHFVCMPLLICWNLYYGIASHSMMSAFFQILFNGWWFSRICLFSMSKTCSIGARSGERLSQGNVLTLLASKEFMEKRAVCDRTLFCWKTKRLFLCMNGTTSGCKCYHSSAVHSVFVLSQSSRSYLHNALLLHNSNYLPPKRSTGIAQATAKRSPGLSRHECDHLQILVWIEIHPKKVLSSSFGAIADLSMQLLSFVVDS